MTRDLPVVRRARPSGRRLGSRHVTASSGCMPERRVFARLVAIAEFMLQAELPEPTRQLLAATVDAMGEAMFADWLATYEAVAATDDDDKRLIIRERTQEQW